MIPAVILLLIGLFSVYFYQLYGGYEAFNRYVIFFIFFPFSYFIIVPAPLPSISPFMVTILVFVFMATAYDKFIFKLGLFDFLIILYVLSYGITYTLTSDFKTGTTEFLEEMVYCLCPYFMTRILVDRHGVMKTLLFYAFILTGIALLAPLEFVFNIQPDWFVHYLWHPNFNHYGFSRNGFYRVYSTFVHPILASLAFAIAALVAFGALRMKVFANKKIPWAILLVNLMAIYTTVTRSSYGLIVLTLILLNTIFVKRIVMYSVFWITILGLILVIAIPYWDSYVTDKNVDYKDEQRTSAIYRAELFPDYWPVVMSSPIFGHGRHIPEVNGKNSIDDNYLLMALQLGIPATALYMTFNFLIMLAGYIHFFKSRVRREQQVLWLVLAILVFFYILQFSVYIPAQAQVILFIINGLAVNLIEEKEIRFKRMVIFKRVL